MRIGRSVHADEIDLSAGRRELRGLHRAIVECAGLHGDVAADQRDTGAFCHFELAALNSNRTWIRAEKAKSRDRCDAQKGIGRCIANGVEPHAIGKSQVVCTGEAHHPTDINGGVGPKEKAGGIHQEEIRTAKPGGLNGAEDVGEVSAGDPAQDVGGGKARVIEKVRNVVVRDIEVPEAVKQIWAASRSGPARDVELRLSSWRRRRQGDLRVEPGWRNWWLGQGDRARDDQEEREDEDETWNNPRVFQMWLRHIEPPSGRVTTHNDSKNDTACAEATNEASHVRNTPICCESFILVFWSCPSTDRAVLHCGTLHDERLWQNRPDEENARISKMDVTKAVGSDVSPVRRTERNVFPVVVGRRMPTCSLCYPLTIDFLFRHSHGGTGCESVFSLR